MCSRFVRASQNGVAGGERACIAAPIGPARITGISESKTMLSNKLSEKLEALERFVDAWLSARNATRRELGLPERAPT